MLILFTLFHYYNPVHLTLEIILETLEIYMILPPANESWWCLPAYIWGALLSKLTTSVAVFDERERVFVFSQQDFDIGILASGMMNYDHSIIVNLCRADSSNVIGIIFMSWQSLQASLNFPKLSHRLAGDWARFYNSKWPVVSDPKDVKSRRDLCERGHRSVVTLQPVLGHESKRESDGVERNFISQNLTTHLTIPAFRLLYTIEHPESCRSGSY